MAFPGSQGASTRSAHPPRRRSRGAPGDLVTRVLAWAAASGIGAAIVIMITIAAAGPSAAVVTMPAPAFGPPWWFAGHLAIRPVVFSLWAAVLAGGAGTAAGLVAVARGARPPVRALLAAAFTAVAVLTVLPPVGSTDILDYAAYGRTVVIGRNPYVMTPGQLRRIRDPIGEAAPHAWSKRYSPYGPLATAEQAAAANLGGTSAARITFWLKLWNSLAFCAVVLALDRLLRTDPARRARAHLLWSLNPLLLWNLVAGGHIDALAAGVGFLGLTLVSAPRRGERPGALAGLAAGALVGAAADIKITFALFGLAVAGTVRRSPVALTAAVGGAAAVLVPTYLWFGEPALAVLVRRSTAVTSDNFYQLFSRAFGDAVPPHLVWVVVPLFAAVAALLLARLPEGCPALPAVRPAFALSAAWLLVWPYQRPWYDAIVLCLLALYPASRLDWVLLARFVAGTFFYVPGMPVGLPSGWMARVGQVEHVPVVPLVMLGALAATVVLAITGAWRPGRERERGAGHRTAQRPVAG